jgi:riboflavin synthase
MPFDKAQDKLQYENEMTIRYPIELRGLIVEKGSIAVDGVSLTVTHVDGETFSVALIPTTLEKTTLKSLHEGSLVNLEADILGKYAKNMV